MCFLRAGITPGSQQQSDMGSVQLQVVDVQYMGTLCSEWFFFGTLRTCVGSICRV